ncbi:MAG: efflux RND transporter permease subunit [Pseudoflavonifractor sp.]|nr:efflux RND transporter permease subunit [Pseudoflavonifractor sp.]
MKRPVIFWSFMVGIIAAGIMAFIMMPKLEDPPIAMKQAMVAIPYPGASAHEVELNVARLVEDELRALPDVKKIKTECSDGMAMFTVEFKMTVLSKDLEQHFDLLRRKVNDVAARLPQGCYTPVVIDDMMDVYGIFYALTGDGYSYAELDRYAKMIRRELLDVSGVKRINIVGGSDEEIEIVLSKENLSRNGLIPAQLMMTLQSVGKPADSGKYDDGTDLIRMQVDSPVNDEEALREMVVATIDGKHIRLGDVAQISRRYAEPQRNGFFVNGQPALAICIAMEQDAVVPDVGKAVSRKLDSVMGQLPAGLEVDKIFYQPDKVDSAISSFMINLLESVVIVILVLIFTMGLRSGLIIGFGLVLTVALSFPILLVCGTTLQRISLGAFIVAMGMLVDNAVVIMDGILIDRKRGLGPKTYLYRIGKNTMLPLLGATVIAASTFICVYLSPDSAGEYAHDLFLVLCVSLLVSWILALVQVPVCAKAWLPAREKVCSTEQTFNDKTHRIIRAIVTFVIGHKLLASSIAILALALSVFGMTKVKNLFFPDFDYNQFVVECFFPAQTSPDRVRDELLDMSRQLEQTPGIERVAVSMGSAPALYCLVRPMTSGGDCYGELIVDCKDYNEVVRLLPEVRRSLRENYPDAYIRTRKYNFSISTSHTVEVEFAGPDPAVLRQLSAEAEKIMRDCKYVDPYSVQNNWKSPGNTLVAEYVRQDGVRSGIARTDVANALLAATTGLTVGVVSDQDRLLPINLKIRNSDGSRITDPNDIPVWSMMNVSIDNDDVNGMLTGGKTMSEIQDRMFRTVPLSSVTDGIRLDGEELKVMRLNGKRVIEAECDPNPDMADATPAKVTAEIQRAIEAIKLPPGYTMRWVGEGELSGEAIGNLMRYIPLTVFLILGILLLLFNSWKKVTLVLICFPFVLVGIVPLLLISRQPLTFMAIIGLMGLLGMMIKNAIVLVDEINRLRVSGGMDAYHAVMEATVSRTRPVLMASLTTIVGMIPLVPDPMYSSMALVIMGGLSMGTVVTLILLPLFYAAMFKIKKPSAINR